MAGIKRWFRTDFGMIVWIPITLLVFGSLMAAFFLVIYRPSHPGSSWESQAWDFFGSEQFKIAAVSIGLPLVLLLVETQFKFVQRLQESRVKHAAEQEAARRAQLAEERETRNERRLETLASTNKMLEDLFDLSAKVIFYKRLDGTRSGPEPIEEVQRSLWALVIRAEQAVHQWTIRLHIDPADADLLIEFINVIWLASDGTARYLRDDSLPPEHIFRVQAALEVVVDRCKSICHHSIRRMVDLSVQLRELEDLEESLPVLAQRAQNLGEIGDEREKLKAWGNWIREFTRTNEELLGGRNEDAVQQLRTAVRAAETWLGEDEVRAIGDYAEYWALKNDLLAVPVTSRYANGTFWYSSDFIQALADQMLFDGLVERIEIRARPKPFL